MKKCIPTVSIETFHFVGGTLSEVILITGSEIEIEFDVAILNDKDAHNTFTISVDGAPVEWEYLSYFDFGTYGDRGGVVNVRLKDPLDAGVPRGRRRTSTAEEYLNRTEHIKGPAAAKRITVSVKGQEEKTAKWEPFYMERSQGYMSRYYAYASQKAGNNGTVLRLNEADGTGSFYDTGADNRNIFTETTALYTDEYVARMVGESMNHLTGRSEYLNLPMIYDGFKALIVGPSQSVYEVPEYREIYAHGETDDIYTRHSIKASDIPGNLNEATNKFKKPFIVGTSDDIFNHYSAVQADGTPSTGSDNAARRPDNHFDFGEAFFDAFYHLGVIRGSQGYPRTAFNKYEDFAFDLHIKEAYEKALAAGKWPNTKMMESIKDYYIGGALTHFEMIKETQNFEWTTWPVNTRAELEDYDYPLFWALSGIHSQYQFWCGSGNDQSVDTNNDNWKYHTPWFWQNQVDEYGLPETPNGTAGVPYSPLAIESVEVVDHNAVHITFNREIKTLGTVSQASNWRIYLDGREIVPGMAGGYSWKAVRLTTNHVVNYQTGESIRNADNRLDNGKPYGRYFSGFTAEDIEERKIDAGGWIDNNQQPGKFALEPGDFVGFKDAINHYGADMSGKVEIAYVGDPTAVLDWSGNGLTPNEKHEATFMPWVGNVYRTPLTGFYIYLDSKVGTKDYYMYRNEPEGFIQPGPKEIAMTAGHQYEAQFANNKTITYPTNAGGAAFDYAIDDNSIDDWSLTNPSWGIDYTWDHGVAELAGQTIKQGPVTYDRPGQMTIDGFVRNSGGLMIAAGNVRGGHPRNLPHRGRLTRNIGEALRIEGHGGNLFDTIDTAVLRDYNLSLYRNESLVHHEGGHGIDSATRVYAQHIFNDITSAYIAATAPKNGMRYFSVDGVQAYNISVRNRVEYVPMGSTYYTGVSREQFEGVNDGTWTPISNRYEFNKYDPYGFEAHKRLMFNGDLSLWYEGKIGDPAYRVIPEDWEILRDTVPEFSHWTSENDLIAWGLTITPIAADNPYTGQRNPLVRWISYNNPCIWQLEPYKEPTKTDWRSNIRYDFVGRSPYYPTEDGQPPTKSMTHPFFVVDEDGVMKGVKMPVRPAAIKALVRPVEGKVIDGSITMPRPVLVQFKMEYYGGEITMNNAPSSFELKIDGKLTHFYFWDFEEDNGVAKVTLRLEWPVERGANVEISNTVTTVSATPDNFN